MPILLDKYGPVVGEDVILQLKAIARFFEGKKIVHVNSTKQGGGVAEILNKMLPLLWDLGIDATWEVIGGDEKFFQCTKNFHNALQGFRPEIPDSLLKWYEKTNVENAEKLRTALEGADYVFVHDPQPASIIQHFPKRKGKWVWRCHIDASKPYRPVWKFLRRFVAEYDASVFSLPEFAQPLPCPQYIIPPAIDPLGDKNVDLRDSEIYSIYPTFKIDRERPFVLQVSRFDRFKDPVGVIRAYKLAKEFHPNIQLVLAGGTAADDPEGEAVLTEVRQAAQGDADIKILLLPPDAHKTINALQRAADVVLQKSTKEGFGLTVTEAMWKEKPVIGGDTGGIRLQVVNHYTGFLVGSPEGAALRIRYLLRKKERGREMGRRAKQFVRDYFLITRQLRDYLMLLIGMENPTKQMNYLNYR